ncbi:hypothetical protein HY991_05625 [Candidatus Micrarchaeota archaeon]|nr:hypothetical protein [Candidatus Micrarchaeota archaeon]
MQVFLSACGEGFGHSSRMAAALTALQRSGHGGIIATYGSALERLRTMCLPVFETLPELTMVGKKGKLDVLRSVIASSTISSRFLKAVQLEAAGMRKMRADVVISDSRISTVIAGYRLGLPTFYVCNQTSYYKKSSKKLRLDLEELEERAIGTLMTAPLVLPPFFSDEILVPDFPPPDTISLPLMSRENALKKMTSFIGPLSLTTLVKPKKAEWRATKPRVLVTMGGQAFRRGEYDELKKIISKNREFNFIVSSVFAEKEERIASAQFVKFLPDILPYQNAAGFLVMPAGHSGIIESIVFGKPALLLPDASQPEQLSNARRYKELGLGEFLELKHLHKFEATLSKLKQNKEKHLRNISRLSALSKKEMNGALNIVKKCEEYGKRMSY